MNNAKLNFTKSFERKIKVDGEYYLISQDYGGQSLYMFKEITTQGWVLLYTYNAITNHVIYEDQVKQMITRVFNQAQVDRYALKS
jgi:hypothetical protein